MARLVSDVNCSKILSRYAEYLSDVSDVRYTRDGIPKQGFREPSTMFCDNVTFGLPSAMSIADGITKLRQILGFGGSKLMRADNGQGRARLIYTPVSVFTPQQLAACNAADIVMLDIDYTVDVRHITTRLLALAHLRGENRPEADISSDEDEEIIHIADRGIKSVGRNCVSWWLDIDSVPGRVDKVRCKIYNLFARTLEIAGVRVPFGSGLSELLDGSSSADTLREYQNSGVTRIELTFYGPELLSHDIYQTALMQTLNSLRRCPTFSCSLSRQWQSFREALTRVAAVHHVASSTFAICQWWNSDTGKMQGASRTIRVVDEVTKLLGNFSFPDMPIYLIRITEEGENIEIYRRSTIGRPMTVCAGSRRGMYPSGGRYKLHEYGDGVGLVGGSSVSHIGWPATYSFRSAALATIELQTIAADVEILTGELEALTITNSHYVMAHKCLVPGQTYTVVGTGIGEYRGKQYTYVKLSNDQRVRCGTSLAALVQQQAGARFSFTVDRIPPPKKGYYDAICFLSSSANP